ncbi:MULTISPECIES: hypothetical protein [Flavobacterium]|uniref:Outer membrane protein beta-barrel domain-containing protein n=1 Tax=Flavobacterium jumunjinense TaxID=998845 RepID=A0ABV5GK16_9FLAO|nr:MULTISPECIES: hypothetical protein [Flavobacterium]
MEKWITSLALLFTFNCMNAQIKVEIKDQVLNVNDGNENKKEFHLIHGTDINKNKTINYGVYDLMTDGAEATFEGIINYKKVAAENKIMFWKKGDLEGNAYIYYYCATDSIFVKDISKCTKESTSKTISYEHANQIPFPSFQEPDDTKLIANKTNRYLIIDASANHNKKINNSLFKAKDVDTFGEADEFDKNFTKADALPVNGSVTIFIRNYNFHDLEKIAVEMSGADFSYSYSIKDILAQLKDKIDDPKKEVTAATAYKEKEKLNNDLTNILAKFKEYTYLNLNDLYKIEEYKRQLYQFYEKNYATFGEEEIAIFSEIIHWYPAYLSITPIAITVPENDEVAINVTLKNKNDDTPYQTKVGQFKTTGGIGFNLGGMFYITNLKNNSVYTKASETTGQVRAFMNSDNQSSVGIGLNSEIYFRTGYLVRPTLNMGFFLPFDEDLTPFGAIGPGISIASKKVKFSISWGLAVGKINTIREQYKDVEIDPTDLTNDQLGEKVWKFGNYFGFGLTYNL